MESTGLAISGGVDSMALASICSAFTKQNKQFQDCNPFSGFIVDHGLRPESKDEALKVAEELRRLGIGPEILGLDWSPYGNPKCLTNFETIARRLRYQAIGKACFRQRISTVLVAHHADDVGETVLSRIVARYLGEGLQGVKSRTPIPECEGIYGASASGMPRSFNIWNDETGGKERQEKRMPCSMMTIENGGVYLERPLLLFAKTQLIEVCQKDGVVWFEDSTNTDKTLTMRNAIRHLQQDGSLPAALQRPRLTEVAKKLREKHKLYEYRAKEIYDTMSIELNMTTSKVTFSLPEDINFGMTGNGEPYHVKAILARKLLMLVSPLQVISLQDLDPAVEALFAELSKKSSKTQVQGVIIHKSPLPGVQLDSFTISQQPPHRSSVKANELSPLKTLTKTSRDNKHYWTDWRLWDNRYWMRVGCLSAKNTNPEHLRFFVNFLTPGTTHAIRSSLLSSEPAVRGSLSGALHLAGDSKWSQPIITMKVDDGKSSTVEVNGSEEAIALPALGWTKGAEAGAVKRLGLVCQIRYKAVEFGGGKGHKVVEPVAQRKPTGSRARAMEQQARRLAKIDEAWSSAG